MQQNAKSNLRAARSKAKAFSNWKKALVPFKEHQVSECHKIVIDYETNLFRTCGNVWEMFSDAAKKTMESNRICFIKVIECLQYLAWQGQAMQGDTDDKSNLIQLLKLRGKDQPLLLKKWLESKEDRYTPPGGGVVLPEKLGGGVRPASLNPYPFYDLHLRNSLPYL